MVMESNLELAIHNSQLFFMNDFSYIKCIQKWTFKKTKFDASAFIK